MENGQEFVDYYALLQVNPTCDAKILEKAYRHFAHMYHPDHRETADIEKFQAINDAYRVLRDHKKRAEYDRVHHIHKADETPKFKFDNEIQIDEQSAIDDAEAHEKILHFLYKKRRETPGDAGVIGFYVQEMLGCSAESFEFHSWYLKSKGFIQITEQGTLAITIEGVDHVISTSRKSESERLLISQSADITE
ncbi:J domain-containing protein [Qipengyuania psychrotolerans]|uniref:DnaJ domain-containing protein n=1 Tax=Qipengyuania psychrotolerans TaxID=2867238 RepID=A0ABX8ZDX1_9SPHN|nr:DnaJ domain-containing protein [Qipengyuania psychrotolerans]QZD86404.1 DnaJ domain-containing protein [Qipengyuania psychrotolerans]